MKAFVVCALILLNGVSQAQYPVWPRHHPVDMRLALGGEIVGRQAVFEWEEPDLLGFVCAPEITGTRVILRQGQVVRRFDVVATKPMGGGRVSVAINFDNIDDVEVWTASFNDVGESIAGETRRFKVDLVAPASPR